MAVPENVQDVVAHYESFINDTMKENLKRIESKLQRINTEIVEFTQIKKSLELYAKDMFKDGFKTQVDVGCNFFLEAKVDDASRLLFNIGLDHFLEFTPDEARKYAEARIDVLERCAKGLREQSAQTKAHIKLMLFGIGELQNVRVDNESTAGNFVYEERRL